MRRTQAGERRNEIHTIVISEKHCDIRRLLGIGDDAKPIAQPLHRRSSVEDRCLKRVNFRPPGLPTEREQQTGIRLIKIVSR